MRPSLAAAARVFDPPFTVGALAVAVFCIWAARDAGYAPATWYAGALFLVGLLVAVVVSYGRLDVSRPALAALLSLGLFAGWCAVSIAWASDRGIAWDGANRTLLYAAVYALFVCLPLRRSSIPILLCSYAVGVLAIGVVDLARAADDPTRFFLYGRLIAPAGYANAACALYLLAFWPVAYVASRREVAPLLRGALLAAATVLVDLAFLTQSRGSLFAVPVAVLAYLVLVPGRLRAGLALAVVAAAVLASRARLLDVFDPLRQGAGVAAAIHDALVTLGIGAAVVFVLWTAVAALDRRLEVGERAVRTANRTALALVGVALLAGVVWLAQASPGPSDRLGTAWRHFKGGYPEEDSSRGSRFTLGLGSNRYDFWRVAVHEFRAHPLRGVGVDNFADDYVRQRRSTEEPLYPHSLALRVPAQTGVIGSLFFLGFVVAVAAAIRRGAGASTSLAAGTARAGVAAAVYFAIHGSGDWLWEFAGLGAPAFAWLGIASSRPNGNGGPARPLRLGLAAAAVVVAVSFVFPWLAELDARRAVRTWSADPAAAFADLDRSRRLNPLSARADLLAGAIASRRNDLPTMAAAFSRAAGRDSQNWYAYFELSLAEAGLGRRAAALRDLRRAAVLNPREPAIPIVRRDLVAGRRIDRARIDRLFVERVRSRVGP